MWVVTVHVQECYELMSQLRVHVVSVREISARIGLGQRCVKSIVKYDQR